MAKRSKTEIYQVEDGRWVKVGTAVNKKKAIRLWFSKEVPTRTWLTILKKNFIEELDFPEEKDE